MAAGPSLHIFPPVEEVNRRRESLDHLIRRSMNMRPTGPWPARGDSYSPVAEVKAEVKATKSPDSLSPQENPNVGVAITRDRTPSPAPERVQVLPPIAEARTSPRENLFQQLPPIQVPKRAPSATRSTRPRRSSSVGARNRNVAASPSQRRAPSPGPYSSRRSDASPVSVSSNATPASMAAPSFTYEREMSTRPSNRGRVCVPKPTGDGGEVAAITSPINPGNYYNMPALPPPPSRQTSVRSNHAQPLQRQASQMSSASRSSQRSRFPPSPDRRYQDLQTPISEYGVSPSTTLVRNSFASHKGWTPVTPPQHDLPMRSMFPVFNPSLPLAQQAYRPPSVAPLSVISPDRISKAPYSPGFDSALLLPKKTDPVYITPVGDLSSLWSTANGKLKAPDPKNFTLKMFRQEKKGEKEKLIFGPAEDLPFYTLSKTHTKTEEGDDHELLIQRHHTAEEDILPVSHLDLHPPPPPTLSKATRGSVMSDVDMPAQHVTTITPILATLHALEGAAKTPQAQSIALVDPNATSPAAARLAERAVAEATQRESCAVAWTVTDAMNGKYELQHPSLGIFSIATCGDIKSAVEFNVVKGPTSISIINPYASVSPINDSPVSAGSRGSVATAVDREPEILARIDFQEECMHIDAAAIQQLGNLYLIDVCVSALLSVAVAEAKRPEDPGLVFAAPPPSLLSVKATSKKIKNPKIKEITEPFVAKPAKKKKPRPVTLMANSLGLGFEHLADKEELPRITKAILSLLGISFKGAVYLMGMGVKVMAAMVIGITKMAMKD